MKGSRAIHQALGGTKAVLAEEQPTIDFAYACVVTTKDVGQGERFTEENLWVKRPGTGELKADQYERVLGTKAKIAIKADTQLTAEMIDE